MVAELQLSAQQEEDARLDFKKADKDPKILIVTDKLLTGYDAPLLYCMYLDKPMRDHVLLQAIARVNRPYIDPEGNRKRVGLVVDFVGVLRELRKALQFDSSDVSGAIEGLDELLRDFLKKIDQAKSDYLEEPSDGADDERLEQVVYGRFLDPENRKVFFDAYKEIEALWEILSPSAELRDNIDTFKQLAQLYAAVRNAYTTNVTYVADLASKTSRMVQERSSQEGLGYLTRTVTFDMQTLNALRGEKGSDEAKVFNLVRGLQREIDNGPEMGSVLRPLKERAEHILKDMEERTTTGLAALDLLAALAREKESAVRSRKDSGLSPRAFGVYWAFKDASDLHAAGVNAMDLAGESESLLGRFPNAAVSADEERRLRAALYRPLLVLPADGRSRAVEHLLTILLGTDVDVDR